MPRGPIDPALSSPVALAGRVVTMDQQGTIHDSAVVYIRDGAITDIRPVGTARPSGFDDVEITHTRGTIYPGLIELHNHLPYDVLGLWPVPERYGNRDQWSKNTPLYQQLITGPMRVLGTNPDLVAAIVRYVEVRALLGGTTTSQGVTLMVAPGIVSQFRGLVRNVESTGDQRLPPATTHIADVEATDAEKFLARISGSQKTILHLAEGTDAHAHDAFTALKVGPRKWAITSNLVGIHCVGLRASDFNVYARHGGSMVWSPLSNLLLYGATADIAAALDSQVLMALGSDWAPSGSKNLLGELKVARLVAAAEQVPLTDRDLVAMATSNPAKMLGWHQRLGSLQEGKLADLLVLPGTPADPYAQLVDATEADIRLVIINGVPRVGTPQLMKSLRGDGPAGEELAIAGRQRVLNLSQGTADPRVEPLTLAEAIRRLELALAALGDPSPRGTQFRSLSNVTSNVVQAFTEGRAILAAAQLVNNHMSSSPHLPLRGRLTGPDLDELVPVPLRDLIEPRATGIGFVRATPLEAFRRELATAPLSMHPLTLDPLTAVDNATFYDELVANTNLPNDVRDGLTSLKPSH